MTQSSTPPKSPLKPLDIVHASAVADVDDKSSVSTDSVRVAAPGSENDSLSQANTTDETGATQTNERREFGGPKGLEPTRYGDWERKGRCVDF